MGGTGGTRLRTARGGIAALAAVGSALGLALALPAGGSAAVEVSVPCDGAGGGPQGLVDAIDAANADGGGTIELASDCTYSFTTGASDAGQGPTALPQIETDVEITGESSTIERQKSSAQFRLLEVADSDTAALTLSGVTLQQGANGYVDNGQGGAILLGSEGSLLVRNSLLRNNSSVNGGAIASHGAAVRIVDSVLRGNRATLVDGVGGAVIQRDGPVRIESSRITNNQSTGGGGGVSAQSVSQPSLLEITDSTIADNQTLENGGGGVFTVGSETLVIERSTISGNELTGPGAAGSGAGIFASGETAINDSTITGNVAGDSAGSDSIGGGVSFEEGASGAITSSTIARNSVLGTNGSGAGIAHGDGLTLASTIVAQNDGGNCLGHPDDGGYNLEDGDSCGFSTDAVNDNPRLRPLADNGGETDTMALRRKSPALNVVPTGVITCGGTEDQRGVPRPQGPRCDIGALEVVATTTKLKVKRGGTPGRFNLIARVKPDVAIPGNPAGKVAFHDRGKRLGKVQLKGKKNRAKLKVRLKPGKHRLKATYKGSSVFLLSDSPTRKLSVKRR
jgi:hypothetical protein